MHVVCPELLFELARRCLQVCPSRALDARIYCAIRGMTDANDLITASGIEARAQGAVLLLAPGLRGWVSTPRFTSDLDCAKSLLPPGVLTRGAGRRDVRCGAHDRPGGLVTPCRVASGHTRLD